MLIKIAILLIAQKIVLKILLIACMPSLGMVTLNALAAADSVIIPVQAQYLPAKGMTQLMQTIQKVKQHINPSLKIDGILLNIVDNRTNLAKSTADALRKNYGKEIIDEYCLEEFERDEGADYSDLSEVKVAYTTTEDDKHKIQANVNLVVFKISGMMYAAKRLGLKEQEKPQKKSRVHRRYIIFIEPVFPLSIMTVFGSL